MSLSLQDHIESQKALSAEETSTDNTAGNDSIYNSDTERRKKIRIRNLLLRGDAITINKDGDVRISANENTDNKITIPVPNIYEMIPSSFFSDKLAEGSDNVESFNKSEKLGFPPEGRFSEKEEEKKKKELYKKLISVDPKAVEEERIRLRNLLLYDDTETTDKHRDVEISANEKTDSEITIHVPKIIF